MAMSSSKNVLSRLIRRSHIKLPYPSTYAFCSGNTNTNSKEELEEFISSYYGKNKNYASLFGKNYHFGYFPHLSDNSQSILNFLESGTALTQHMCKIGNINSNSNVIDFGCGIGGPAFDISQSMNCRVKFFSIHIFCIFYYLFFLYIL